ncbi:MAG: hypothetical protein ACYDHH_04195 [Solirubrobacteraceae bacterium]
MPESTIGGRRPQASAVRVLAVAPRTGWPGYLTWEQFGARFTLVEHAPQVVVLQVIDENLRAVSADLSPSLRALELGVPAVLFDARDRPRGATRWDRTAAELVGRADLVVGQNLPLSLGGRGVGMLYHSRPRSEALGVAYRGSAAPIEMSFVGMFRRPQPGAKPAIRSLEGRGLQLAALARELPNRRLAIHRNDYWAACEIGDVRVIEGMHRHYARVLADSAMVFSPPGAGFNCIRHTEAWQHRRLLLTPKLHERVLVPEPELWRERAIAVDYDFNAENLVAAARWGLDHADALADRVAEGHGYYQRWGTAAARLDQIEHALRSLVG